MLAPACGEARRDPGEFSRQVAQFDRQPREPPRARHAALDDRGQYQRIDVAAAQHQPDLASGESAGGAEQRRQPRRARAFDDRFLDLEQHHDRLLEIALADQHDVVDQLAHDRQRQLAGLSDRDAFGDGVQAELRSSAASARSTSRGNARLCTPMILMFGPERLAAVAMPAISPPPPIGTTSTSRSRLLRQHLQRDRALAGDHLRSS